MCCCAKPNINGEPGYSWDGKNIGSHPVNPPGLIDGDVLLFDEPGRCGGMDCHSHHFRLVKHYSSETLLARHGGGDKRIRVSLPSGKRSDFDLSAMDSNTRYWVLHAIYYAHCDGERKGAEETGHKYRAAFADGRLKKRKLPAQGTVKVWIEAMA